MFLFCAGFPSLKFAQTVNITCFVCFGSCLNSEDFFLSFRNAKVGGKNYHCCKKNSLSVFRNPSGAYSQLQLCLRIEVAKYFGVLRQVVVLQGEVALPVTFIIGGFVIETCCKSLYRCERISTLPSITLARYLPCFINQAI